MVNVSCSQRCFLTLLFFSHNAMSGIPVGSGIISLFSQEINTQINQNKGSYFLECATLSLLLSLKTLLLSVNIWNEICGLGSQENNHSCPYLRRKLNL